MKIVSYFIYNWIFGNNLLLEWCIWMTCSLTKKRIFGNLIFTAKNCMQFSPKGGNQELIIF